MICLFESPKAMYCSLGLMEIALIELSIYYKRRLDLLESSAWYLMIFIEFNIFFNICINSNYISFLNIFYFLNNTLFKGIFCLRTVCVINNITVYVFDDFSALIWVIDLIP